MGLYGHRSKLFQKYCVCVSIQQQIVQSHNPFAHLVPIVTSSLLSFRPYNNRHIMSTTLNTDVVMKDTSTKPLPLPENRFELELEFIQCLASPAYLHHLATTGVLADRDFLDFLEYLQYWKQPEYVKYLNYPHCLYFLDLLLNNAIFRRELANIPFRNFVHEQQFYSWQHRARTLYGQGLPAEVMEEKKEESVVKEEENDDEDDDGEEEEDTPSPSQ